MSGQQDASRAAWDESSEKFLIEKLLDEVKRGKRAENGFKKESYITVMFELNSRYSLSLDAQQIKNKYNALKKKYDTFSMLRSNSGFGWDEVNHLPTAPPDVWERYLKAHPNAKEFRFKTLRNLILLEELFSDTRATGEYAITPSQIPCFLINSNHIPPTTHRIPRKRQANTSWSILENNSDDGQGSDIDESQPNLPIDPEIIFSNALIPTETSITQAPNLQQYLRDSQTPFYSNINPESINQAKRQCRIKKSTGKAIADALVDIKDTALTIHRDSMSGKSKTEQAIIKLQKEYGAVLDIEEMILAADVFESIMKCEMFVVMEPGDFRDKWLKKQINNLRDK